MEIVELTRRGTPRIKKKKVFLTNEEKEFLMTTSGLYNVHELVEKLGGKYTKVQIYNWARRLGVKIKHLTKKEEKRRRCTVNENFFDSWSYDMAYIFGFWCADGCISRRKDGVKVFNLCVHKKDKKLLEEIKEAMESNSPIRENKHNMAAIYINNEAIYDSIIRLGGTEKKSLTLKMPQIPEEFMPDFIRGYYDGDGGLIGGGQNIEIVSTKDFCLSLKEFLEEKIDCELRLVNPACKTNNITSRLFTRNWRQWKKLYDYIYPTDREKPYLYMERKKVFKRGGRSLFYSMKEKKEILQLVEEGTPLEEIWERFFPHLKAKDRFMAALRRISEAVHNPPAPRHWRGTHSQEEKDNIFHALLSGEKFLDIYNNFCAEKMQYKYFRAEFIKDILKENGYSVDILKFKKESIHK